MTSIQTMTVSALLVAGIGLTAAACQPQVLPRPSNALAPAEVEELFIGKTALGTVQGRRAATYLAPDGTARLKVIGHNGVVVEFDGTYYSNEQGASCVNFPTLPIYGKDRCNYIVPLEDGRYQQSFDKGITERILDGQRLDELK